MYEKNFIDIMEYIYDIEKKKYTNLEGDAPTNYGIIQDTYDGWNKKHNKPLKDVKYITEEEANEIYYNEFWIASGANKLKDLRQAYYLFDMAVNSGVPEALKIFKRSNGNMSDFIEKRKAYYEDTIKAHPEKEKNRQGWYARLDKLKKQADILIERQLKREKTKHLLKTFPMEFSGNSAPETMSSKDFKNNQEKIEKELDERYKILEENGYIKNNIVKDFKKNKNDLTGSVQKNDYISFIVNKIRNLVLKVKKRIKKETFDENFSLNLNDKKDIKENNKKQEKLFKNRVLNNLSNNRLIIDETKNTPILEIEKENELNKDNNKYNETEQIKQKLPLKTNTDNSLDLNYINIEGLKNKNVKVVEEVALKDGFIFIDNGEIKTISENDLYDKFLSLFSKDLKEAYNNRSSRWKYYEGYDIGV